MKEDIIIEKLGEHEERLVRIEDKQDRFGERQDRFGEKQDRFEATQEKIIEKLLDHDEKLDQMATKTDLQELRHEMLAGQDKMITILERLDQERVFTNQAIERLEHRVEENTKEIQTIKTQLKIA